MARGLCSQRTYKFEHKTRSLISLYINSRSNNLAVTCDSAVIRLYAYLNSSDIYSDFFQPVKDSDHETDAANFSPAKCSSRPTPVYFSYSR